MKLIKTANGKKTVKMSRKEWQSIGKKAGWAIPSDEFMEENGICVYDYSYKNDKYATDCNALINCDFIDNLILDEKKMRNDARCPKCGKKIVVQGNPDEDKNTDYDEEGM